MVRVKDINPTDFRYSEKYVNHYKALEYVIITILLFVLTIIFWHLMAHLLGAIKKCEKIIKE